MCGIIGFTSSRGDLAYDIDRGLRALRHRGPEAAIARHFRWNAGQSVLGHTRLRVIDNREEADQPLSDGSGKAWIVYNGELYNHEELRAALERSGHVFSSLTDTEVIVHLYEELAGNMPKILDRLRGMFAFAIIDTSVGRLVLARDRLGIKPLYWTAVPGGVGFSSEVRGLLQARMAASRPNLSAIGSYLTWGSVRGPETVLEDVHEVEPGTYAEWCDGSIDNRRWWHPAIQPHAELGDAAVAQQALHEALTDSVRRHLVADRPVGLFLSSGIDSGSLATVAASLGQIKTLTVSFNGPDEADPARRVARQLGTSHTQAHIEADDVLASLPKIIGAMDQPTVDGVNTWIVSRAAHQAGLVVALSGVGGDELFGGYPSFSMIPRARSLARLTVRMPPRLRDAVAAQVAARSAGARSTRLLGASPDVGQVYGAIRGLFAPIEIPAAIPHDDPPRAPDTADIGDAVTLLELTNYMPHQLLRDTDQMSMAHSLEVRVPLLDDELLKLALRIPAPVRLYRGKALLVRAAGLEMPLKKRPFTLPFDSWLRAELLSELRESLLSQELPLAGALPLQFRRSVLDSFNAGRTHWSRPWALLVLRRWSDANGLSW